MKPSSPRIKATPTKSKSTLELLQKAKAITLVMED